MPPEKQGNTRQKATRSPADRAAGHAPADAPPRPARKPRGTAKAATEPAPVAAGSERRTAGRSVRGGRSTREPGPALEELAARRDELLASLTAAEGRLRELRALDREAAARIATTRAEAERLRRDAEGAAGTFGEAARLLESARRDADAMKRSVAEAVELVGISERRAEAIKAEVAGTRQELDRLAADLRRARGGLDGSADRAEAAPGAGRSAARAAAADEWPRVDALPADELAPDAKERLTDYLKETWGAEKELGDLFQSLADASADAGLRARLEEGRRLAEERHTRVGERVRALGSEPSGGSGLVGRLAARMWDVLQKPRGETDEAVQALLKGLAAAEFTAGLYGAVRALAAATGDSATAELAEAHLRELTRHAGQLRCDIAPAAASLVRGRS